MAGKNLIGKLGKLGSGALRSTVSSFVSEELSKKALDVLQTHLDQHQDDRRVPDVTGLKVDEAEIVLEQLEFTYSKARLDPDVRYADKQANVVLQITPKPNKKVAPHTFVKLFYLDEAGVEASQQLRAHRLADKAAKKAAQQAKVGRVGENVKNATTGIVKKVHLPFKKKPKEEDR